MTFLKEFQSSHLVVATLGIVYGDIGTSPLYAFKKCFDYLSIQISPGIVLGIVSLIIWSLFIIVTLKYVFFLLNVDNKGEGGILSLAALCLSLKNHGLDKKITLLGMLGAALFYGDGVLTPAISILSALEGIEIISPRLGPYIPLAAIGLVVGLFTIQKYGTSVIGLFFGPLMILWFSALGLMGLYQIFLMPFVLKALNPWYAFQFLWNNPSVGILTCGSIVLVLTGAEALYADMGHFTKKSIRYSWNFFVFPALILNYLGQGALLLQDASTLSNPFYLMAPKWGTYPLLILSTLATIVASQSVISGIFSLTYQATRLGYFPLMNVIHTSNNQHGQIYIPFMNKLMLFLTIIAVIIFRTSNDLAAAYGMTVTAIMMITTGLFVFYLFYQRFSIWKIVLIGGPLFIIDSCFLAATAPKFFAGGWFPFSISLVFLSVMITWRKGMSVLKYESPFFKKPLETVVQLTQLQQTITIPKTAIFIRHQRQYLPSALLVHLKHNTYLHKQIILLSILTNEEVPKIPASKRIILNPLLTNVYEAVISYGFRDVPNLKAILEQLIEQGLTIDLNETSFILNKIIPVASSHPVMRGWQEKLFIFLMHNALSVTDFYKIPHQHVLELGIRFKI